MVLILSGPVHGGKTTFLEQCLPLWARRGLACEGFLSPAIAEGNGDKGYDLVEIGTGRRWPYLRRQREAGPEERIGPYSFVSATLERARSIIRGAGPSGLLIVDEIGPLELRGGGLWPALREALRRPGGTVLLVAREEVLAELAAALAPLVPVVFDVRDPEDRKLLVERLPAGDNPDDGQS